MPDQAQRGIIGVDVGGTKIAAGVVLLPSGQVLRREVIPTGAARGGAAVLRDARGLVEQLHNAVERDVQVEAIGIGVAELVDRDGIVRSAHTIDWRDMPIGEHFADLAPTTVESDVRAAAMAEAYLGAGRDRELWVYLTVGTGISSCLVQDGRPLAGAHGNALVLASSPLSEVCPACGAQIETVLEDVASGPGLVACYNRQASTRLARAEEVLEAAAGGDPHAEAVARSAGEALGNSVAFLVNVLDPELVVVGGGLGQAQGLYWQHFERSLRRHIWADSSRGVALRRAELGVEAGYIGAAVAAWSSAVRRGSG